MRREKSLESIGNEGKVVAVCDFLCLYLSPPSLVHVLDNLHSQSKDDFNFICCVFFFNGSFSIICLNPVFFPYSLFECIKVYLNENLMQLGSWYGKDWITEVFLIVKHTKNGTCRNQPCGQMEKCLLSTNCSDPT